MPLIDSLYDFQTGPGPGVGPAPYTVTRTAKATYGTDGRSVAGATSTFTVNAVVVPMTGRDLLLFPEAARAGETQWLYSDTLLFTRSETTEPDVVTINNAEGNAESWVVKNVQHFEFLDEEFWRCQVARRTTQ